MESELDFNCTSLSGVNESIKRQILNYLEQKSSEHVSPNIINKPSDEDQTFVKELSTPVVYGTVGRQVLSMRENDVKADKDVNPVKTQHQQLQQTLVTDEDQTFVKKISTPTDADKENENKQLQESLKEPLSQTKILEKENDKVHQTQTETLDFIDQYEGHFHEIKYNETKTIIQFPSTVLCDIVKS